MTIWLTGCTSGLGRALVSEFSQAEHIVVGCGRNELALQRLRDEFPTQHFHTTDVSRDESVLRFCDQAFDAAGPPDLLINNAAVINHHAPLWEISSSEFDELTSININGVANFIRHAVPIMMAHRKGIVVNLSSGWGRSTAPHVAPYCASKYAIEGLTQSLAQELPKPLAAIALNPGIIDTAMLRKTMGEDAGSFSAPEAWAITAAPFLTSLTPEDNGKSLTAP